MTETEDDERLPFARRGEGLRSGREGMLLKVRNVLNIIFMLGAVVGVIYYVSADKQIGVYIILVAMVFKIIESAIRLLRF